MRIVLLFLRHHYFGWNVCLDYIAEICSGTETQFSMKEIAGWTEVAGFVPSDLCCVASVADFCPMSSGDRWGPDPGQAGESGHPLGLRTSCLCAECLITSYCGSGWDRVLLLRSCFSQVCVQQPKRPVQASPATCWVTLSCSLGSLCSGILLTHWQTE